MPTSSQEELEKVQVTADQSGVSLDLGEQNAFVEKITSTNTQSTDIAQIADSLTWWADRVKVDDFLNSELVDVLEGLSQQLRTL